MNELNKMDAGLNLIRIIKSVLQNESAIHFENYHDIYKLAKFHHVEGISFLGIKDYKDIDIYEKWKNDYDKTAIKNVYFDNERSIILSKLKEHGISYMPLKGVNLLPYYSDLGMRFMADNDILYGFVKNGILLEDREQEAQDIVVKIMKELGYDIYSLKGKDDVFTKKPFYNFEMHRRLVSHGSEHSSYYQNPFKNAYVDKDDDNMYHMSLEDEYIYLIEHAYHHMEYAGIGIRYLIDMYVFLRENKLILDMDYIENEINKLNINDFYHKSYKLCINAFEKIMDNDDLKFLSLLLSCGTYGTNKQQFENRIKDKNKLEYLTKRIFVEEKYYKEQYPLAFKYPILKLFLPIYRLSLALIHSPKRILQEIKLLIRK